MNWTRRVGAVPLLALTAVVAPMLTDASAQAATERARSSVSSPPESPPPGALLSAFAGNQLKYCSLICPHIIDGLVQVPIALVRAPGVFVDARARTGSTDRATGIAAASVTGPANSAMAGIIGDDLDLVLPRAQNALEVAVVEMIAVADKARAGAPPATVGTAFNTARGKTLEALNAPIVPNPPDIATPHTAAQAAALDAIDVGSAILFQAPEQVMAGATDAADIAARRLAATGDVNSARATGMAHLNDTVAQAGEAIRRSITNHHVPQGDG
ncbi:hypothetical protein AAFP35_03850 [Gordonia sp. CPCC 206044]|uniref:hypothetical protein n=1 Tax=Gordonia sp. CPCC 206044 TaxID=3140793 RepID=UPI003AF3EEEF